MTRCEFCFDPQLPLSVNAGNACLVALRLEPGPPAGVRVTLRCVHGAELRHVSYPWADDWRWCLSRLPNPTEPAAEPPACEAAPAADAGLTT